MSRPTLGVIGGMGPFAGLDLARHIFDQTEATTDQEHLPVVLLSYPGEIGDRSAFLFGEVVENPGHAIAKVALQLSEMGVAVAGIPCNTAHSPPIFNVVQEALHAQGASLRLLNIVEETVRFLKTAAPDLQRVGVLATRGLYKLRVYRNVLEKAGYDAIIPDEGVQNFIVDRAIYDPAYGIKAHSNPISKIARQSVHSAIDHLREQNVDAVILGCTELPLAVPEAEYEGVTLINPSRILARALIHATYPDRLKPL